MGNGIYKNAFFNVLHKVLSVIFPLVTATYAARIILPEGLGKVSYAQTIVSYFLMLATLGIPYYGVREIAKNKENRSQVFWEIFVLSTISTIVCSAIYYAIILGTDAFKNDRNLVVVVGSTLVLNIFNIEWFYQGIEQYKFIAVRSLIIKIIFTASLFIFVHSKDDYVIYALLNCLANAGNHFLNVFSLRKFIGRARNKLNISRHFRPIVVCFVGTVANEIYLHIDTTMLGLMTNDSYVGYYTNSSKLMHVISNALIALGAVMLPRISYYFEYKMKNEIQKTITNVTKLVLWFAVPIMLGTMCVADRLIPFLFGSSFNPAITTMEIHAILIVEFALEAGILAPIMIAMKKERQYSIATFIGVIANFFLNLVLIKRYQHNGAALASVISKAIITIVEIYYVKAYIEKREIEKEVWNITVAGALMAVGVIAVGQLLGGVRNVIVLIIEIFVGVEIYLMIHWLMKDYILRELYEKVLRKLRGKVHE